MTNTRENVDQLADSTREMAASIETLRATISSLAARIATLEGRLEETQAAQTRSATALETLRHEMGKLDMLEARLTEQRREAAESVASEAEATRQALSEFRRRLDASADALSRELAPVEARLGMVEDLPERLKVVDRRHSELVGQVTSLEAQLESFGSERRATEEAMRQYEDRVQSHLGAGDRELSELRSQLSSWQQRIEAQDRTVLEAKAAVSGMEPQIEDLRREQHELTESQRLWESRIDATLETHRSEAEERWTAFLSRREQDWSRNATHHESHERRANELDEAIEASALESEQKLEAVGQSVSELREQGYEIRRRIVAAVERLQQAYSLLTEGMEHGLPEEERSQVIEEERRALRRAARARRESSG